MTDKAPRARRQDALAAFFEDLYAQYHRAEFLAGDPLVVAHQYTKPEDQEVAALLAAAFASGNIKAILATLRPMLAVMGPHPAAWLKEHEPQDLRGKFAGIHHRWVRETDVEILMAMIGCALRRHGLLGGLWRAVDLPEEEPTVLPALARFVEAIHAMPIQPLASRVREVRRADGRVSCLAPIETILLTSPSRGSACKRMNLFLRWMVRPKDGIDLGLWTPFVSPSRLIMPVDVHVLRLSRKLRLTRRKVADMRAAEEITARMRKICPDDPCRYDFSFVRQGVEGPKER